MDQQIFPDPIVTIYHHGLLDPPILGPNFIEAPLSITKYLYNRFPNSGSSVKIANFDKRNSYLNSIIKALELDKQLPSFFVYHEAKFLNCKLHIRETCNETNSQFKTIIEHERRALYSNSNPGAP